MLDILHENHQQRSNDNDTSPLTYQETPIPDSLRIALEHAGINIEQIINMTRQLEMSLKEIDLFESKSKLVKFDSSDQQLSSSLSSKQSNLEYEFPRTNSAPAQSKLPTASQIMFKSNKTAHQFSTLEAKSLPLSSVNLVDEKKTECGGASCDSSNSYSLAEPYHETNFKKNNVSNKSITSTYNLRGLEMRQNVSATVSQEILTSSKESISNQQTKVQNEAPTLPRPESKNVRKKSISSTRYATVSNFTVPNSANSPENNPSKVYSTSTELVCSFLE